MKPETFYFMKKGQADTKLSAAVPTHSSCSRLCTPTSASQTLFEYAKPVEN